MMTQYGIVRDVLLISVRIYPDFNPSGLEKELAISTVAPSNPHSTHLAQDEHTIPPKRRHQQHPLMQSTTSPHM